MTWNFGLKVECDLRLVRVVRKNRKYGHHGGVAARDVPVAVLAGCVIIHVARQGEKSPCKHKGAAPE
jgi:hypothetical protein